MLGLLGAVFGARLVLLTLLAPNQPDAFVWWQAGRHYLTDSAHLYDPVVRAVGYQVLPQPGAYEGFFNPPLLAVLAVPFALLPSGPGVHLWAAFNLACAGAGLVLLYRTGSIGAPPAARALFWLVAAAFPPLFADAIAGQVGGVILGLTCGAIVLARRRASAAGALVGLAAGIKVYPAVMMLAAPAGRRLRFVGGVAAGLLVPLALAFLPIGASGPVVYVRDVLLPVNRIQTVDCAVVSVDTLFLRLVGGNRFIVLDSAGTPVLTQLPIQLPGLAMALFYASAVTMLAGVAWGLWRSGGDAAYGLALALALGALLPHHVFPYQLLPLLPVVLLVVTRAAAARRWWVLAALLLPLLGFVRDPCNLPFPNTWTVAAMVMFGVCVYAAPMFRRPPGGAVSPATRTPA
ncbi:MAG: hypothetical protein QOE92_2264 [Chloroflexota bacterium]|nr:hypothetical protein [Chloroflexota bacterium]